MIRNFAEEITGKSIGKCWADRFVKKNHIELLARWTSAIDASRHKADSAFKYSLYFELLRQKIEEYGIDSRHIYNMDEKGFLICILSKSKRIFSRHAYEAGKLKAQLPDGNREWITTLACICADGSALTPALIYQAASGSSCLRLSQLVTRASSPTLWLIVKASHLSLSATSASFTARGTRRLSKKNVLKAFETTGIAPFDPQRILARFNTKEPSRPSPSGSSSSVLSASDWRKIERLLREVVEDTYDRQSKKLSQTIHAISVQKQLLQHQNERLKEALINEKKRRQRGKALLLEPPKDYNGGAVFWSPSKVEAARQRQEEKDEAEATLQHQKSEAIKLREQQKLQKEQLLEERRRRRVAVKEERKRVAAEKAVQREDQKLARALEKQLQQDLKTSQRSKRQSLKLTAPKKQPPKVVVEVPDDGEPSGAASPPPPTTSRRGRAIKLPPKFLE
tara:strand:- start:4978 stop:6333 length:1356 start_codon:yes stop_codon:yes gene_type:complete